jgi:spore coat protein U-like protein
MKDRKIEATGQRFLPQETPALKNGKPAGNGGMQSNRSNGRKPYDSGTTRGTCDEFSFFDAACVRFPRVIPRDVRREWLQCLQELSDRLWIRYFIPTLEGNLIMFTKKQASLLAAALASISFGALAASPANSTLTTDVTLTTACETNGASAIHFADTVALLSSGDNTANSGSTFQVACSNSATPTIYATGTRAMVNGSNSLAFNLSLTSGAASDDLPSTSGSAAALSITQDGTMKVVALYAKTLATNFAALPSGAYTGDVTVSVAY